mmetsp:Transcript_54352/g.157830  ORF Transcript_54352/g.157830 Transcript_54352/m.157830 type:complete len:214 (+) Transcript_54352:141-782(+)
MPLEADLQARHWEAPAGNSSAKAWPAIDVSTTPEAYANTATQSTEAGGHALTCVAAPRSAAWNLNSLVDAPGSSTKGRVPRVALRARVLRGLHHGPGRTAMHLRVLDHGQLRVWALHGLSTVHEVCVRALPGPAPGCGLRALHLVTVLMVVWLRMRERRLLLVHWHGAWRPREAPRIRRLEALRPRLTIHRVPLPGAVLEVHRGSRRPHAAGW